MIGRMMHVREPAETAAAERANRQRSRVDARVRDELAVDWKVSRPGTRVVALVGCGKSKASAPAKARDLYTSPLFRKSLELAELVADAVYIVSAAKCLVDLDEEITPYDVQLSKRHADEWANYVVAELGARTLSSSPRVRLVLFMGERYALPIVRVVERFRERSTTWDAPCDLLHGLEIGDRLAFLNRAIAVAKLKKGGSR